MNVCQGLWSPKWGGLSMRGSIRKTVQALLKACLCKAPQVPKLWAHFCYGSLLRFPKTENVCLCELDTLSWSPNSLMSEAWFRALC